MKTIIVKNQLEGGKVAFDLLKESLAAGAQTLGLDTGSSPTASIKRWLKVTWIFRNFTVSIWMSMLD